jgi:hypothetical protein
VEEDQEAPDVVIGMLSHPEISILATTSYSEKVYFHHDFHQEIAYSS